MISQHLVYLMAATLLLGSSSCNGGGQDDSSTDPRQDDVNELCVKNCLKPLCSGTILPSPDYGDLCASSCETKVEQAQDECLVEYEALLACLDETSCPDYYSWYNELEGAPCSDLEAEVASSCPSIQVRDGE